MADIGDKETSMKILEKRKEVEKSRILLRIQQLELRILEIEDEKIKINNEIESLKKSLEEINSLKA